MSTDEPISITADQLAAKLPYEQRLNVAKALIAVAYEICPKDEAEYRMGDPGPVSLDLAKFALDAVNLLLRSPSEIERRSGWWAVMRERRDSAHRLQ